MLDECVTHLVHNVLPAAADYEAAEQALSEAYRQNHEEASWQGAARTAKRRAAELAVAIDGLTDRCHVELGMSKTAVRRTVAGLCSFPGSTIMRAGAHDRVRGVANAYKHMDLNDPTLPIASDADVIVIGLGYGLDGWGVGKFGGVEVLVRERGGETWKFLGDVPVTISAWFQFLSANGATLPTGPYSFWGLQIHP